MLYVTVIEQDDIEVDFGELDDDHLNRLLATGFDIHDIYLFDPNVVQFEAGSALDVLEPSEDFGTSEVYWFLDWLYWAGKNYPNAKFHFAIKEG